MIAPQNKPSPADAGMPRRLFIKGVIAASVATVLSRRQAFAEMKWTDKLKPAGERVNLACCGIGCQGGTDVMKLYNTGMANIVALCDVDMGGPQTLEVLKKFPDVPQFKDFREMLDKMGREIDAVTVGVPDFSHFPIAMMAMAMGKHIYVEKPMAHTFQETELMMRAEKKYKVAAQMGNQGHSGPNYHQFKAWTEAGVIKNVTKITAFMNGARRWHGWDVSAWPPAEPIPGTLDWDKWLSTAEFHAYNSKYVQGNWRCWYDFGNGALGDWGAHIMDAPHQFLDLGLPEEINAVKLDGHSRFIFPQASTLSFKFPARSQMPPMEIMWYDGVKNLPPLPADFGEAIVDADIPPPGSGKIEKKQAPGKVIYGEGLTFQGSSHGAPLKIIDSQAKDMTLPAYPKGSDHYQNFLLACKGQEKCRSSFDVAGPLSQVLMLGVIAQRLDTKLVFDRATKQITNNTAANQLLAGPPPRQGWEQYYKL